MPDPLLCPQCGSDEVMPRVRIADRGESNARYDLQVEVQRRPNALLFKRPEHANLRASRATPDDMPPSSSQRMRITLNVAGALCLLMGCVWFLQGINILPGSFMTGQTKWAVYGGLLAVAGIALLVSANRRRT